VNRDAGVESESLQRLEYTAPKPCAVVIALAGSCQAFCANRPQIAICGYRATLPYRA